MKWKQNRWSLQIQHKINLGGILQAGTTLTHGELKNIGRDLGTVANYANLAITGWYKNTLEGRVEKRWVLRSENTIFHFSQLICPIPVLVK